MKKTVVSKKKSSVLPSKTKIKNKIRGLWNEIPWPFFHQEKDWYQKCHQWCKELADREDIDLMCVVALFSIMSPQCSFRQNKIFCELYLKGIKKHTKVQNAKADLVLHLHGIDAYEVRKEKMLSIIGGAKTCNFFLNILDPTDPEACTIDRHALVIAGITRPTVTKVQYNYIKAAYVEVAKELGILPVHLQASTWSWYRKQKFGHSLYD